ncbi:zinc-ribbon domain-containing protein [Candidatus Pseudothioglobus singularis]|nr:zinc-ribbon domain-containing protein [Candidatus Pseudothioglobus singularis]
MKLSSYPLLVKEWHPTNNGELTPDDITHGSVKKVWWLCSEGHSFETEVRNRTRQKYQRGCPQCPSHRPTTSNNLQLLFPEIAKEWHPTKNNNLTPEQVSATSRNNAWWLCTKGHSYEAKIGNRTRWGESKCPYCLHRRLGDDNNLLAEFPEIAKEWHPTKNGELFPEQFVSGTKKKVWWLCPQQHSYEASIQTRTKKNPTSCPHCSNQSSEPEIRILSELKWFFDEVKHRYKFDGLEIDVFLPSANIGIEYDGKYWHRNLTDIDLEKNQFMAAKGIHLIRVRQRPLSPLTGDDVMVGYSLEKKDLDEILKRIAPHIDNTIKEKINTYLAQSNFVNDELFKAYRSNFPSPLPENSLLETHPELSKEWDYEKNYPLKPENFSYGSHQKVWWLCPIGHSNKSVIQSRTEKRARGCPYCSGRKKLSRLTTE